MSSLEFYLHRSKYLRLLSASHTPIPTHAIDYANKYLRPFYDSHPGEFQRLLSCIMYLPKLETSPYADLASPTVHCDLEPMFATEFSACLGLSKQVPLKVVGDIGGGGALAKIEKGRKIMRERKSEWSQADELPVSAYKVMALCCLLMLILIYRSKYLCHRKIDITLSLRVPCPRTKRQSRTHR